MRLFTHVIFDLDGTLTDNSLGIKNAIKYALEQMQIDDFNGVVPDEFIGPPLQQGFRRIYGLNDRNTDLAVEYFREYYASYGKFQNRPYPGISELLEELHSSGMKLYVATSKLERFAREIVEHFGFDKYIHQLRGAGYDRENATKPGIVSELLKSEKLIPSKEIVMVGDTVFDMDGGKQNGLATIAVTYGFGEKDALQNTAPDFLAESVEDLYRILV